MLRDFESICDIFDVKAGAVIRLQREGNPNLGMMYSKRTVAIVWASLEVEGKASIHPVSVS